MSNNTIRAALVIAVIGAGVVATVTNSSQSRFYTQGLATGKGTIANPVDMPIYTDSTFLDGGTGISDAVPLSVVEAVSAIDVAAFGTGTDGALTYASNTTLSTDVYATDITINLGVTVIPNGYWIFATGTLTLNGDIRRNGANGINGPPSSNSIGGCTSASCSPVSNTGHFPTGSCANSANSLFQAVSAAAGGTAGIAASGGNGANASGVAAGGGGGGSAGCTTGNGSVGIVGGSITHLTSTTNGDIADPRYLMSGRPWAGSPPLGSGGGAGAAGNGGSNQCKGGGAPGQAGGMVVVFAKKIVGSGVIAADGGNGGNGGGGTALSSGAGGGGGGGGGIVLVTMGGGTWNNLHANGGTGGIGSASTNALCTLPRKGGDGGNGSNGYAIRFCAGACL